MEAVSTQALAYSHRKNPNQTYDSICHRCFSTVATESNESALAKHEQQHECGAMAQARTLMHKDTYMSAGRMISSSVDAA